mmetsp:Transcript_75882/g.197641  ORF Transcript_75882/g.197641 Transcript_75882/m.197641 type:complete len:290 (+) Transcript_75882:118-987(+)
MHSLADGTLIVERIAGHATVDGAVERIVGEGPIHHAAGVPDLAAFLQKGKVVDILDVLVDWVDFLVLRELVHNAHKHENLIALTAAVEETLTAAEPQGHVLAVAGPATAADDTLRVDGRDEHRVLDGAEGADEGRGLEVLVQLDDTEDVLSSLVYDRESHVAAKLLVGFLGQVLRVHDGALCTDAPVPVGVNEAQRIRVGRHQGLDVLRHGLRVELEVLGQHTPPMAVAAASVHLEGCGHRRDDAPHVRMPRGRRRGIQRTSCGAASKAEHGCEASWVKPGGKVGATEA